MALTDLFSSLFKKKKKKEGGTDNSTASFSDWKNTASDQSKRDTVKQAEKKEQAKKAETKKAEAQKNQGDSKLKKSLTDMISDIGKVQTMNTEAKLEPSKKAGEEVSKAINIFGEEQEKKREKLKYEMAKNGGNRQAAQNAVDRSNTYADTDSKLYNKVHNFGVGAQELGSNLGTGFTNDTMSSLVSGIANAAQAVHNIPYDAMRRQYDRNNEMLRRDHFTGIPEGMDEATYRQSIETQNKRLLEQMNAYNTNGIVGSDAVNTALNGFQRGSREVHEYYRDSDSPIMNNLYNTFENAGSNIGNMAVGTALGALGVPASVGGKIALGVSAFGNEADNQLQNTGNQDAAVSAAQQAGQAAVTQANAQIQATYDRVLKATGDKNAALQAAQEVYTRVWNNAAQDAYATALRQTGDPLYAAAKGGVSALNEELQEAISPKGTTFANVASNTADLLMEGVQEAAGTYMEQLEDPLAYAILGGDEYSGKAKESAKEAVNNIAGKNAWNTAKEAGKAFGGGIESSLLLGGLTNPTGLAEGIREDANRAYAIRRNQVGLNEVNKNISAIESATAGRNLTEAEQKALNDEYAKKADYERFFANDYFSKSSSRSMQKSAQKHAEELTNISAKLSNAKISDTTLNNIKALSKATKTAVEFNDDLYDADGNMVNGLYKDGVIHINSNLSADQATETVLAHEMAHSLETSENYNAYKNALNDLIEKGDVDIGYDSIDDLHNAIRQTYGDQISDKQLDNETVAFITEKLIGNETALTELAQNNSSLAGRLSSWIDNTAEQFSGDRAQSQLAKVRKLLNRAINTTERGNGGVEYKERTPEEKAKIANEKLNLLRRSGPYMFSNDKKKAEEVVTDLARRYGEGELTEEQVSDELNKQLGDPTLANSDESTNSIDVKSLKAYQDFEKLAGKETAHQYLGPIVTKMDDGQMNLDDAEERFIDLTKKLKQANKKQAVKEKTGKKQSKAKSAKETKADEVKVEESAADAVARMNAEKQEQAAKNAKKSHEFFQNVKEADAAKAKAQQEKQEKQEKVETEKQRAKRLAKEERDKARAERQAEKDAEAKAKAEETAFKKNYSDLGNDKFSGVPVTLRNDFKWSAQKFIKTRTSTISSALPEGTSEETKTAIFNNVKYKALTDYQQESFNALKNNTDVSEEAKNKAVDDVVKILKDNGVEKLNEVKGKSFDNLEDAVRNILFPPRGGARKAKTAKTAEQQDQKIFDQTMNQPKVEKPKTKTAKTEKVKAPIAETKAEEVKAPVVKKVEQPKAKTVKQQTQAIFDKTVNNIEKKTPYKVKVTPENRQAITDKVEKYKADFVQRLVDLGAERDVSERLAQKIAETGRWKANSADVSIENDNDRQTAWHQIEKANPNYKTEDINKWLEDAKALIPNQYRNIGLYENPTYWANGNVKTDETKAANAQAKLLTDAGVSGELANETVNAILNKTGGKDGNKATWAKGTYNDLMAAVANKEGLNLKDDADKAKARDILGGLKRQIKEQLAENGGKTSKIVEQNANVTPAVTESGAEVNSSVFKSIATDGVLSASEKHSQETKAISQKLNEIHEEQQKEYGDKYLPAVVYPRVDEEMRVLANAFNISDKSMSENQEQVKAIRDIFVNSQINPDYIGPRADYQKLSEYEKKRIDDAVKADDEREKKAKNYYNKTADRQYEEHKSARRMAYSRQFTKDIVDQASEVLKNGTGLTIDKQSPEQLGDTVNKYLSTNLHGFNFFDMVRPHKRMENDRASALEVAKGKQLADELTDRIEKLEAKLPEGTHIRYDTHSVKGTDVKAETVTLYDAQQKRVEVKDKSVQQTLDLIEKYSNYKLSVSFKGNTYGHQAGQMLALYKQMLASHPANRWNQMIDQVKKIQGRLEKESRHGGQNGEVPNLVDLVKNMTDENGNNIYDLWDKDGADYDKLMDTIETKVAEAIPVNAIDAWDQWRYLAMLANPTTHFRNIIGNKGSTAMYVNKSAYRRLTEYALEKMGMVQTHTIDFSNESEVALNDYAEGNVDSVLTDLLNTYRADNTVASGQIEKRFKSFIKNNVNNQFTFGTNDSLRLRTATELAWRLKENGYTLSEENTIVDKNGTEIEPRTLQQYAAESYNEASKRFVASSDIRNMNRYGMKESEAQSKRLEKYYTDVLKEGGSKFTENFTKDFIGKVNEKAQFSTFEKFAPKFLKFAGRGSDRVASFNNEHLENEDVKPTTRNYVREANNILNAQGYSVESLTKDEVVLKDHLGREIKGQRAKEIFDNISNKALATAKESTFHDFNATAQAMNELARDSKGWKFAFDTFMPFRSTPFNIGHRLVEFSPAGLVYSTTYQFNKVREGQVSVDTWLESMTKGMTGTQIALIGYLLAKAGILHGSDPDKDPKEKKFEQELGGDQDYSVVLERDETGNPTKTASLGWFAPASGPLFTGVQLYETARDNGVKIEPYALANIAKSAIAPILDASYMSGITSSFDTVQNMMEYGIQLTEDGAKSFTPDMVGAILVAGAENYLAQGSTSLGGKLVKIFDKNDYDTYSNNPFDTVARTAVSKNLITHYAVNSINAQVEGNPYLRPKVNSNGVAQTNTGGNVLGRAAYNLLSPAKYSYDRMDDTDRELERLYNATKKNYVLPQKYYRLRDLNLSNEERYQINTKYLSDQHAEITSFMESSVYETLDDETKADIIASIRRNSYNNATVEAYTDAGLKTYGVLSSTDETLNKLMSFNDGSTGFHKWQYYGLSKAGNDKDATGQTIKGSRALNARMVYEAAGIWDDVQKAVLNGDLKASDVFLTNDVVSYTDEEYTAQYNSYANGDMNLGGKGQQTSDAGQELLDNVSESLGRTNRAEIAGVDMADIVKASYAKSIYDQDGKAITYSQDVNARGAFTAEEIAGYQKAVADGKMTYDEVAKDTGIGVKVLMASESDYQTLAKAIEEGTYTAKLARSILKKYKNPSTGNNTSTASVKKAADDDDAKVVISMLKKFADAMADASESQAKAYKKQLQTSINNLEKSDQDIYDEVMSADSLTKKLGLYGIKIKSQA